MELNDFQSGLRFARNVPATGIFTYQEHAAAGMVYLGCKFPGQILQVNIGSAVSCLQSRDDKFSANAGCYVLFCLDFISERYQEWIAVVKHLMSQLLMKSSLFLGQTSCQRVVVGAQRDPEEHCAWISGPRADLNSKVVKF